MSKLIIQVPLSYFSKADFTHSIDARVETLQLQIQIAYENKSISFKIRVHEDFPIVEDQENIVNIHGKFCYLSENKINNRALKVAKKEATKEDWA